MKKIIALSALLTLGFAFNANAQQKKPAVKAAQTTKVALPATAAEVTAAAKKNVSSLNSVVSLTDQEKQMFQGLFETKYNNLNQVAKTGNNKAAKEEVYKNIELKLRASLSADKIAKLDANPAVLTAITHE